MKSRRTWGLIVFVVALALRLAYIHEHHSVLGLDVSLLPQTDNHTFVSWARIIADGDWLCREQPHAYHLWTQDVAPEGRWLEWYGGAQTFHQSPLYAYLVAGVYRTLGTAHAIVGYVQAVLGALTCLLTFLLASRVASLRVGVLAGGLLAFYGGFYFYDAFVLRDGLMALFVVLTALALDRAVQSRRAVDWLLAGASLGLFTLAKETGPALLALSLLGVGWAWRRQPAVVLKVAALLVVGWIVVIAPAAARNKAVGAPTFRFSTRGPEVFVAGNALGEDGVSWDPRSEVMRPILMDSNFSLPKAMALTLATHRARPWGYVELLWNKTAAFFNGYEVPNNVNFYLNKEHLLSLRVGLVSMTFLGPAALLGLLLALPRRRRFMVPYALFGTLTASVIALYILARFRLQVLPLMALFAAYTVDWSWRALQQRRWAPLVLAGALFALLVAWAWPAASLFNDLNKNAAIMVMHIKTGNFEQASRYRERQEQVIGEVDPSTMDESLEWKLAALDEGFEFFDVALAHPEDSVQRSINLGHGYASLIRITKRAEKVEITNLAMGHYRRALELDPAVVGAHHGMGTVHGRGGDARMALSAFKRELALHPDHVPSHRDAGLILFAWGDHLGAVRHFEYALTEGLDEPQVLAAAARVGIDKTWRDRELSGGAPVYDPALAHARARRALEAAPDDPLVLESVAIVFYAVGSEADDQALVDRGVELLEQLRAEQYWRDGELAKRIEVFQRWVPSTEREEAAEAEAPPEAPSEETDPADG